MVSENIYRYLKNDIDLNSYFGDRIFWVISNTDNQSLKKNLPRIIYKCMDDPAKYMNEDKWQRWRFYIHAHSQFECQNLSDLLTSKLNRLYGDMEGKNIDFIQKLNTGVIELRDDKIYENYIDFRIIYH